MSHIGIFCLPMASHMNVFSALGKELRRRGHQVFFFNLPSNKERVREAGFEFRSVEPLTLPPGTLDAMTREMASLPALKALRLQGRFDELRYEAILERGPALIREANLGMMIVDQAEACSGTLAEAAGLPWVTVASGLCMNSEPRVPPFFTTWAYASDRRSEWRNRSLYAALRLMTLRTVGIINRHRRKWRLKRVCRMDDAFSPYAQICQQPAEFDFPRRELPPCFHYVGPIRDPEPLSIAFDWARLNSRRLIYASLGTVVNRQPNLYHLIAESCQGLDAQLVISLGGSDEPADFQNLPASPVVVKFAPQRELISRAALTITHAGLNTTLESLTAGVPLVAIPITFEQPGIAARIRWTRTGDFIPVSRVSAKDLRTLIKEVLGNPQYRASAKIMGEKIKATHGLTRAVDIIENVSKLPTCRTI